MATIGFNGQWVDIFRAGRQTDSSGRAHDITVDFLDQVIANFNPEEHEPPVVIGHPQNDAPAYGWVCALRREGDKLQAQFCDVDPGFEELLRAGRFRKRSASFYVDGAGSPGGRAPVLRHVGFLGAQPPAVKGLRNIHFNDGLAVTFEEEQPMDNNEVKTIGDRVIEYIKSVFALGEKASFALTKDDVDARLKQTEAALASFSERIEQLQSENKTLREQVDQHRNVSRRAELVEFCERLGMAKCPPALRRAGLIEFMEALARMETTIDFAENGETKKIKPLEWFQRFLQQLPPFVAFGEHFASLHSTSDVNVVDPERMKALRAHLSMGGQHADKNN